MAELTIGSIVNSRIADLESENARLRLDLARSREMVASLHGVITRLHIERRDVEEKHAKERSRLLRENDRLLRIIAGLEPPR